VRQVSYGQDAKVREMRRADTFLHIIEDQGKLYEAKVKETRKLESRMMRQVSSPVRRRAGRKGRKNGPRSQPILLQRSRSTFSWRSFLSFFAFQGGMLSTPISVLGGWPTVSEGFPRHHQNSLWQKVSFLSSVQFANTIGKPGAQEQHDLAACLGR